MEELEISEAIEVLKKQSMELARLGEALYLVEKPRLANRIHRIMLALVPVEKSVEEYFKQQEG